MPRKKFDENRTSPIDQESDQRSLMCHAHGCPNRWSVQHDGEPGMCSAHAWRYPIEWPSITEEQLWNETERARMRGNTPTPQPNQLTTDEKLAILAKLRATVTQFQAQKQNPKAWAYLLLGRESTGEKLTITQREMMQAAIRGNS